MLRHGSLKARLGIGAGLLGLATLLTAGLLTVGMAQVSKRVEIALASERRLEQYSALSTQVSTYYIVVAELIQSGLSPEARGQRTEVLAATLGQSFATLRAGLDAEVASAARAGLDAQSRRAARSLTIARMEALLETTQSGLTAPTADPVRLRAYLDGFASGIDPLLSEAVNEEKRLRAAILTGIEALRQRLTRLAIGIGVAAVLLSFAFYFRLVRPELRRLDLLRDAAKRIGQEDFSIALPDAGQDEIGQLSTETNRMAQTLATRAGQVAADRAALNETIRQRTEDLRAAKTRLERIDEDRRRFFADISHELRTPLTVILMEAQLGKAGAPEPEQAFATIEERATRLNRRIDDLLRIARSETGQLTLEEQALDLAQLTREATAETRAEIVNAGMELSLSEFEPLPVTGDRNWLRQVIVGLLRNTIRHGRSGGLIRLEARRQGPCCEIAILDNGPGVAPEDQARIFDRFAQGGDGRGASHRQGFGLGLALAHWVVAQQGGEIAIESPLPPERALGAGAGSKFTVRMPLRMG
ncbi:sensor histidine kinase [Celeribacter neptunius]|uniref:histidine kinase n=1 Tax=Celeribacter neptunius TaxID=588602 RepID=A0A1I3W377_9RHOB|nr:HAMP domain-containing sensor histidine kinase [Celeribacter neptunius]SFK00946.1 hypothetical protein SAMN04487991_3510 [Celeribacter neptunius]